MIALAMSALSGVWVRVALAALLIGTAVGTYMMIKQSGRDAERAAVAIQGARDNAQANRTRADVDGLGDSAVIDRLRRFQRQ